MQLGKVNVQITKAALKRKKLFIKMKTWNIFIKIYMIIIFGHICRIFFLIYTEL